MDNREYKNDVFVDLFLKSDDAFKNFASLFGALCKFLRMDIQFKRENIKPIAINSSLYNGGRTDVLYSIKDEFYSLLSISQ